MPRRYRTQTGEQTARQLQKHDVNSTERVKKALSIVLQGGTYEAAAQAAGYAGRSSAYDAIQAELRRTITPMAEEIKQLELMRLDGLLSVFYPKALGGDGWSCDRVLRIMERRALYLGLDARQESLVSAQVLVRQYDAPVDAV